MHPTHPSRPPSDVCPFCGKTYKRLKSHLPHCKAAANPTTPSARIDTLQQKEKSSPLVSDQSLLVGTTPRLKKTKETSQLRTTPAASLQNEVPLSPLQSSQSSASAKKKKQKLSDLIKAAAAAASSSPSSSAPITSTQSPPAAPTIPKPKKNRDLALTEATKTDHVTHQAAPAPTRSDPNRGDSISLSADPKAPPATEVKLSWPSEPSFSPDFKAGQSGVDFSASSSGTEDSSVTRLTSKAGSSHQVDRISIQDAKTMLGRNSSRRAGVLHQFVLPGSEAEVRTGGGLSAPSRQAESNLFPNIPSSLLPLVQARGSNQQCSTWLLPPQASQATPNPLAHVGCLNEALHTISPILSPFRRHHPPPVGPWMFPGRAEPQPEHGRASRARNTTSGRGATGQWHFSRTAAF